MVHCLDAQLGNVDVLGAILASADILYPCSHLGNVVCSCYLPLKKYKEILLKMKNPSRNRPHYQILEEIAT